MYLTVLEVDQPLVPNRSFQLILAFTNKIIKFNKTSKFYSWNFNLGEMFVFVHCFPLWYQHLGMAVNPNLAFTSIPLGASLSHPLLLAP